MIGSLRSAATLWGVNTSPYMRVPSLEMLTLRQAMSPGAVKAAGLGAVCALAHHEMRTTHTASLMSLLLLGMALDDFDAHLVGALDERELDLPSQNAARRIGNGDAFILQARERRIELIHTEPDVIHYAALGRLEG